MTPFVRQHFAHIAFAAALLAATYGCLLIWMPYQQEQRVIRKIYAGGGSVMERYEGPEWFPQWLKNRLPVFQRVVGVVLSNDTVPVRILRDLQALHRLESLNLHGMAVSDDDFEFLKCLKPLIDLTITNAQISDAGMEQITGLTNLEFLDLSGTRFSDAGGEHLKELTDLRILILDGTQISDEALAMLRKLLPNCEVICRHAEQSAVDLRDRPCPDE